MNNVAIPNDKRTIKTDIPWVEKYRPKSVAEMVGFQNVIAELKKFLETFLQLRSRIKQLRDQLTRTPTPQLKRQLDETINKFRLLGTARLLIGPPGIGKTTVVYALAHDFNLSVIELNASDVRTEDAINQRLRETVKSTNLLSFTQQKTAGKIILIDEVDGISGQSDRGGVAALEKIIKSSQFPILLTCNFHDEAKFGVIYQVAPPIKIDSLQAKNVITLLKRIVTTEQLSITDDTIEAIAEKSKGDFRSAINDLQAVAQGDLDIDEESFEMLNMERDITADVQQFLIQLFSSHKIVDAKRILDDVQQDDIDYQTIHRWINENLLNYISIFPDLAYAFENLAIVDRILGIINRTQDYSHLSYFFDILAGGILLVKSDEKYAKANIDKPRWFRTRATPDDENYLKLQKIFRVSLNEILRELRPTLELFIKNLPESRQFLLQKLNLDDKQLDSIFK